MNIDDCVGRLPRMERRAIECLHRLPADEVFSSREIAAMLGVSLSAFWHASSSHTLKPYRHDLGYNHTLWGNPKAIAKLKRRLNKR